MTHFTDLIPLLTSTNYRSGEELAKKLNISKQELSELLHELENLNIELSVRNSDEYRINSKLDLLDATRIKQYIDPAHYEYLQTVQCLLHTTSTNDEAFGLPESEVDKFSVVLAELQTAGRGRRGRTWVSPFAANIYLSIVWQPLEVPATITTLSPLLALSIAHCLQQLNVPSIGVKWPNDIYCSGKKLAGLLIENKINSLGRNKLVVGLGLNVEMPPLVQGVIKQEYTDLRRSVPGWSTSRNELAARLISHMIFTMQNFAHEGAGAIDLAWQDYDIFKNKSVCLEYSGQDLQGIAKGIDAEGRLLLQVDGSTQVFAMGEISMREHL